MLSLAHRIRGSIKSVPLKRFLTASTQSPQHLQQPMEATVGITQFTTHTAGVRGILKQRYSDFVVREVTSNGTVLKLHSTDGKELESKHFPKNKPDNSSTEEIRAKIDEFIIKLSTIESFAVGSGAEDMIASTRCFLEKCADKCDDMDADLVAFECTSKPLRTEMHSLIKQLLPSLVEADTFQTEGTSRLRFKAKHKYAKGRTDPTRRIDAWPKGLGDYLQFTLLKENIDTMNAASVIQRHLRARPGSVEYAGTKDKRAITTQLCTMYRRKPSELARLNAFDLPPFLRVGDFAFVSSPLSLGDSNGNHFDVVLREIGEDADTIEAACKALQERGYINYFGLQRFGKGAVSSHLIGRELFFNRWERAVRMMLEHSASDRPEVFDAKTAFDEGDYSRSLELLPSRKFVERSIVESLLSNPSDFARALNTVPKNTRLICAHAYQSYIWNCVVSHRINRYGYSIVEGDLVALSSTPLDDGANTDRFQRASKDDHKDIVLVTAQDIANNVFSVEDLVLPLVGANIVLPLNDSGDELTRLLAADGLSLEYLRSKAIAEYRMGGAYRRVIQRPKDFGYRIINYSDPSDELFETEVLSFRGSKASSAPESTGRRALHLEFTLPSGSYATMLLREITKDSTDTEFHTSLTDAVDNEQDAEVGHKRLLEGL